MGIRVSLTILAYFHNWEQTAEILRSLGINGKLGAKHAMQGLLADLDQSMGLSGLQNISECQPKILRKSHYPGDRNSNN